MNVLFLCTGNSCRSILGEATFNHLAPSGWHAMSAGSKPTGYVHPRSLALLAGEGISTEGYHSKSWESLPTTPDIVITVCGSAAGETCPAYLGPVIRTHWGVEDPVHVTGTDEEIDAAFFKAYSILRARIEDFFALPLEALKHDKAALKVEMDRIAANVTQGNKMTKIIQIFDPAMCCSSGVCGTEVDQQLVSFSADADWARNNGAQIERFNLAQQPMDFANNKVVRDFLERSGQEALPLILVDGEFALAGRYPNRTELARWAGIASVVEVQPTGCCSGGKCC